MGMYDSFYVKCPKCGEELEFQSKSGECCMSCYGEKGDRDLTVFDGGKLPHHVAIGMDGSIVRCQFCNSRIRFELLNPIVNAKVKLHITGKRRFDYNGNYNPKHPDSIKAQKHLAKLFKETAKTKKELKKMGVKV